MSSCSKSERFTLPAMFMKRLQSLLRRNLLVGATLSFGISASIFFPSGSLAQTSQTHVTRSPAPDAEVKKRVDTLLQQMTPEEKVGQMSQLFLFTKPDAAIESRLAKGQLGSLLFVTDPAVINHLQHVAVEQSRLHIPLLFGFDVIHGFRTIFPVPIAMAASWDPDTIERAQAAAAREARSVGIHWAFAPMVDIARDPRWGRLVEGAGADPYLGSAVAAAQVRGFQGPYIGARITSSHALSTLPVTGLRKAGVTTIRSTSLIRSSATFTCLLLRARWTPVLAPL